jgi:hypothetical protein
VVKKDKIQDVGVIRKLWKAELVTVALPTIVMHYWSQEKIIVSTIGTDDCEKNNWKYDRNR